MGNWNEAILWSSSGSDCGFAAANRRCLVLVRVEAYSQLKNELRFTSQLFKISPNDHIPPQRRFSGRCGESCVDGSVEVSAAGRCLLRILLTYWTDADRIPALTAMLRRKTSSGRLGLRFGV